MSLSRPLRTIVPVLCALFLLASIFTIEFETFDGCPKVKYPVCVDNDITFAANANNDPAFSRPDEAVSFQPPDTGQYSSRPSRSSNLYRGPPVTT